MATPRYPKKIADFVPWIAAHASTWKTSPAAVGLTVPQATAIDTAAKELQAAFDDANKKRIESKNATESQNEALRQTLTLLQQDIRIIDAFAQNSPSPASVYAAANLAAPNVPTPVAAPGAVTDVTVSLDIVTGAPTLKWKGNNPTGGGNVSYIIRRKLTGQPGFEFQGVSGNSGADARTWLDSTLPIGTDNVQYTITAQRGNLTSPQTMVQLQFGSVGSRGNFTFSTGEGEKKLAA